MHRRAGQNAYCMRGALVALVASLSVAFFGPKLLADQYQWKGQPGSWSDPENWTNVVDPDAGGYPVAGDVADFGIPSSVTLDNSPIANTVDIFGAITFSSGTLEVTGQNLLRMFGSGNLTVPSGVSIQANGTLIGVGSGGTMGLSGGTLNEGYETSVGYDSQGTLNITSGGKLSAAKAVFVGGFQNGKGDVTISGSGSTLMVSSEFLVIGNQGKGTMTIDSGGKAIVTPDFLIAGFPSSTGEVTVTGSASSVQASKRIAIGSFGTGTMNILQGSSVTANNDVVVGDAAGSHGTLVMQGSGTTLTVSGGLLNIGANGQGGASISDGAKINTSGSAVIGTETTGDGSLNIGGEGSKLITGAQLQVGRQGQGSLQVVDRATVDVKGLYIDSGSNKQSSATITGFSSVQAHDLVRVATQGNASLSIMQSGQLLSQSGEIGAGGEGIVTITGSGSNWTCDSGIDVGVTSKGTLEITSGGKVSASLVTLGEFPGSDGTLTIDGADSKVAAEDILVGLNGPGTLNLQHGASYNFTKFSTAVGTIQHAAGTVNVQDANTSVQFQNLTLGSAMGDHGTLSVNSNGHATVTNDITIGQGTIDVGSGGNVSVMGAINAALEAQETADITVSGSGARLDVQHDLLLGQNGNANLLVSGGGTVNLVRILCGRDAAATSTQNASIRVQGAGSTINANGISLQRSFHFLEVTDGGYVRLSSFLHLHNGTLNLNGGTIDIGAVIPFPLPNFIRIGPGGDFSSSTEVPNILNLGGRVSVGNSPGLMTVTGDYSQSTGTGLHFSIAGTDADTGYSQLMVGGNLQLAGTLRFDFENGFSPQAGDTFDVIKVNGTSQLGNLHIEIGNLAPGFQYDFSAVPGGYRLTALSSTQFTAPSKGDFNLDGQTTPADIPAMLNALVDLNAFATVHALSDSQLLAIGDLNNSSAVTNADIQPLLDLLAGQGPGNTSVVGVPEPASAALLVIGAAVAVSFVFHARKRFC